MGYRKALASGTVEALAERMKGVRDVDELRRLQCVYFRAKYRYPPAQIAEMTGYALGTVHNIHSEYLARGLAIFDLGRPGGRQAAYLTPEEEGVFLEPFIAPGDAGGILEVGPIHKAHCAAVGKAIPLSTTYRLLHRHGWRKIMPRPRHPKADREAPAAFKKMAEDRRAG